MGRVAFIAGPRPPLRQRTPPAARRYVGIEARLDGTTVKVGRSGPLDFAWFPKKFPRNKLLVIGGSGFQSSVVRGITIEQFLLADGLPHPYPGQVKDPDQYNDLARL